MLLKKGEDWLLDLEGARGLTARAQFRYSIDPEFWSFESGPVYGVSTTRQNIQDLYYNLQEKIWLAGR